MREDMLRTISEFFKSHKEGTAKLIEDIIEEFFKKRSLQHRLTNQIKIYEELIC